MSKFTEDTAYAAERRSARPAGESASAQTTLLTPSQALEYAQKLIPAFRARDYLPAIHAIVEKGYAVQKAIRTVAELSNFSPMTLSDLYYNKAPKGARNARA